MKPVTKVFLLGGTVAAALAWFASAEKKSQAAKAEVPGQPGTQAAAQGNLPPGSIVVATNNTPYMTAPDPNASDRTFPIGATATVLGLGPTGYVNVRVSQATASDLWSTPIGLDGYLLLNDVRRVS